MRMTCWFSGSMMSEISSSKRGIGWTGSLTVRTSLRGEYSGTGGCEGNTYSMTPFHGWVRIAPLPLVVRSRVGSWNMSTTPSDVMWTSGR